MKIILNVSTPNTDFQVELEYEIRIFNLSPVLTKKIQDQLKTNPSYGESFEF